MIALTQEKREELKAFLSASTESRCRVYTLAKQRELEALRDQITLASLTAEPVAFISEAKLKTLHKGIHSVSVKPNAVMVRPNPLFTAPPVPEIKLPSRIENIHLRTPLEVEDMWIDRFKRLNGLGE